MLHSFGEEVGMELGFFWFFFLFSFKRSWSFLSRQFWEALLATKYTIFPITLFGRDPPQSTPCIPQRILIYLICVMSKCRIFHLRKFQDLMKQMTVPKFQNSHWNRNRYIFLQPGMVSSIFFSKLLTIEN